MYYYITEKSTEPDFYLCEVSRDVFCVPHIHYYMEFVFVFDGEITLTKDNKRFLLKKDNFAVVMPYEIHGYETDIHSDILVVGFPPEYISEYENLLSAKTFSNPVLFMSDILKGAAGMFYKNGKKNRFEIKALVYYAISLFLKNSELVDSTVGKNDILRKAIIYISEHYCENITLKSVASKMGITAVHLSRTLSNEGNMSFNSMLTSMRLRKAKKLLEETDLSVSEVAYESGFGSIRNFNRMFERYFKCTPKSVRNKSVEIRFVTTGKNMSQDFS